MCIQPTCLQGSSWLAWIKIFYSIYSCLTITGCSPRLGYHLCYSNLIIHHTNEKLQIWISLLKETSINLKNPNCEKKKKMIGDTSFVTWIGEAEAKLYNETICIFSLQQRQRLDKQRGKSLVSAQRQFYSKQSFHRAAWNSLECYINAQSDAVVTWQGWLALWAGHKDCTLSMAVRRRGWGALKTTTLSNWIQSL